MTMTREKAIETLENHTQYYAPIQDLSALKMALTALRGPTREMVERMFPGCPHCVEDHDGYVLKFGSYCVYNGKLFCGPG